MTGNGRVSPIWNSYWVATSSLAGSGCFPRLPVRLSLVRLGISVEVFDRACRMLGLGRNAVQAKLLAGRRTDEAVPCSDRDSDDVAVAQGKWLID